MPYACIDFETYYDDEYSLKEMSVYAYVNDERFNCYLVGIHGDDVHWVGNPKDFDWRKLQGYTLLAHNVSFDGVVFEKLIEQGIVPKDLCIKEWFDTADLAAYMRCKRNLADASKYLLNKELSKGMRKQMKGKTYEIACALGLKEKLHKYGIEDAVTSFELWEKFNHLWPENERRLSAENRVSMNRGVTINKEALEHALLGTGAKKFPGWETDDNFLGLEIQRREALGTLPWVKEGHPPLSMEHIRAEGRKCGITVPSSLDMKNPDAVAWELQYADQFPWVGSIRDFRRVNSMARKLQNIRDGLRPDGTFCYPCLYFGSHSGRFSGGADRDVGNKFNIMNQYRKTLFGVDPRKLIIPPKGHKFIILDYAQVEARVLLWRVNDRQFLEMIKAENNLYQAYAKRRKRYAGSNLKKDDNNLYQHMKVEVLSCGYQCSWKRYKNVALAQYNLDLSDSQAINAVNAYRETFPLVPAHWARHHRALQYSMAHGDATHEFELASGRKMVYFNPVSRKQEDRPYPEIVANYILGRPQQKLYGGLLTENEIQATCRDLLRDAWLASVDAGFKVAFSVYDELAYIVPEDQANEDTARELSHIMCGSSPWMKDCPLDTEASILDYYTK